MLLDLFRLDTKSFKNSTDADVDYKATEADASLNFVSSIHSEISRGYYDNTNVEYVPLYITIKPLGYQSLINISFEIGNHYKNRYEILNVIDIGDPLTLKNTQYVSQLKKEEELTTS